MKDVSIGELKRLIRLDPMTGLLYWHPRSVSMFKSIIAMRSWNSRFAGKPALNFIDSRGYRCGSLRGRHMLAHRVVFALVHGRWPQDQIDHIDHRRDNNHPLNLREATSLENQRNKGLSRKNTSGFIGVHLNRRSRKWVAVIIDRGESRYLGAYDRKEDAIVARRKAERELGFHPNHGAT